MLPLCFIAFSLSANAQPQPIFNTINFYEPLAVVKEKISNDVLSHSVIEIYKPHFPLAKDKESHLVCTNLTTENGTLSRVVFTFADDQLHYVEARGNAVKTLIETRKDTTGIFMGYKAYFEEGIFAKIDFFKIH